MVQEAEKYKAEDEKQRDKVSSKNSLESYAFNMKATVEDEKLQGKISDEDKQKILDKCNEIINWLDKNQVCQIPCRVPSVSLGHKGRSGWRRSPGCCDESDSKAIRSFHQKSKDWCWSKYLPWMSERPHPIPSG